MIIMWHSRAAPTAGHLRKYSQTFGTAGSSAGSLKSLSSKDPVHGHLVRDELRGGSRIGACRPGRVGVMPLTIGFSAGGARERPLK